MGITSLTALWFMLLGAVFYAAVLVIAAAIVGYGFAWGKHVFERRMRKRIYEEREESETASRH
jgi:hypothetical protein